MDLKDLFNLSWDSLKPVTKSQQVHLELLMAIGSYVNCVDWHDWEWITSLDTESPYSTRSIVDYMNRNTHLKQFKIRPQQLRKTFHRCMSGSAKQQQGKYYGQVLSAIFYKFAEIQEPPLVRNEVPKVLSIGLSFICEHNDWAPELNITPELLSHFQTGIPAAEISKFYLNLINTDSGPTTWIENTVYMRSKSQGPRVEGAEASPESEPETTHATRKRKGRDRKVVVNLLKASIGKPEPLMKAEQLETAEAAAALDLSGLPGSSVLQIGLKQRKFREIIIQAGKDQDILHVDSEPTNGSNSNNIKKSLKKPRITPKKYATGSTFEGLSRNVREYTLGKDSSKFIAFLLKNGYCGPMNKMFAEIEQSIISKNAAKPVEMNTNADVADFADIVEDYTAIPSFSNAMLQLDTDKPETVDKSEQISMPEVPPRPSSTSSSRPDLEFLGPYYTAITSFSNANATLELERQPDTDKPETVDKYEQISMPEVPPRPSSTSSSSPDLEFLGTELLGFCKDETTTDCGEMLPTTATLSFAGSEKNMANDGNFKIEHDSLSGFYFHATMFDDSWLPDYPDGRSV